MLLGHLQGLASTLGNTLAVTFLLQVSQQGPGLPTAFNLRPLELLTLADLLLLASPHRLWYFWACSACRQHWRGLEESLMGRGEAQGYLFPAGLKDMLKTAWLQGARPHRPSTWGGPTRRGTSKEGLP